MLSSVVPNFVTVNMVPAQNRIILIITTTHYNYKSLGFIQPCFGTHAVWFVVLDWQSVFKNRFILC